jgi:hypothetical protein
MARLTTIGVVAGALLAAGALLLAGAPAAMAGASAEQARAAFAIDRGAVDGAGSLLDFVVARMRQSAQTARAVRVDVACQEAERFADFLHDANPAAFARMTAALREGHPFAAAVRIGYGADLNALWDRFVRGEGNQ